MQKLKWCCAVHDAEERKKASREFEMSESLRLRVRSAGLTLTDMC